MVPPWDRIPPRPRRYRGNPIHLIDLPDDIVAFKNFDEGTSITANFINLTKGQTYGVHVRDKDDTYRSEDTGYAFRTLERWYFAKALFKDDTKVQIILAAINTIVPDQKEAILDEVERLSRIVFLNEYNAKRQDEDKSVDMIK